MSILNVAKPENRILDTGYPRDFECIEYYLIHVTHESRRVTSLENIPYDSWDYSCGSSQ